MHKISLLCPTRNNHHEAYAMAKSAFDTADNPDRIEIMFYVDNDDPIVMNYLGSLKDLSYFGCKVIVGPRVNLSLAWNHLASKCTGTIIKMTNDDIRYETKGWDTVIDVETKKFPDDIYVMWFNDTLRRHRLATFPIVSRLWYETLGYFTPDVFKFYWNDTHIYNLGKQLGRLHYMGHVVNRHLHKGTTPAQREVMKEDGELFFGLEQTKRRELDVKKLKKLIHP